MYAICLARFAHDEQQSHTITVFSTVTELLVIFKLLFTLHPLQVQFHILQKDSVSCFKEKLRSV